MISKAGYDFAAKKKQYRTYSMEGLLWAMQDIKETLEAWTGGPHPNEGWYLDDMHTVGAEIQRRRGKPCCPTCGRAK